jgi:DMSO/TMAO reductase YedYZ molybdopterin-dependent catalytic subunit
VEVVFHGLDRGLEGGDPTPQRYARSLRLDDALRDEALLAYEMNGAELPPQHGFPLRLVVPGWYGMANVKWLAGIELVPEPFRGYHQERAYRLRAHADDPGTPVELMRPRALMAPPGVPDFFTRSRTLEPGPCRLEGRAWSGGAPIAAVSVSLDGGATWADATLGDDLGRWAWRGWKLEWDARPGEHVLLCRARDDAGDEQPLEPTWNVGGYANNAVQRVRVTVG